MPLQLLAWPRGVRLGYPLAPSALLLMAFSPLTGDTGGVMGVLADKLTERVILSPAEDAVEVAAAVAVTAAAAVMVAAPLLLLPMAHKVLGNFSWLL